MATRSAANPIWYVEWDETVVGVQSTALLAGAAPPLPTIALLNDTGLVLDDAVTNDGSLVFAPVDTGTTRSFSINGGAGAADYVIPTISGTYTVVVEDTNADGTTTNSFQFVLDLDAPASPIVSLVHDTGTSSSDHVTQDGALVMSGADTGAFVEYTLDDGATWSNTLPSGLVDGTYVIGVRQTDVAGNVSDTGPFTFTVDTSAPDGPTVELNNDTDTPGDLITTDETLVVRNVESGATVEYSIDGGAHWSTSAPTGLANGTYTVVVRQTDLAGNTSDLTEFIFTVLKATDPVDPVDPTDPSSPGSSGTGSGGSDGPDFGGVDFGGVDFGGLGGADLGGGLCGGDFGIF